MLLKLLIVLGLVILVSLPWLLPRKGRHETNGTGDLDNAGVNISGAVAGSGSDSHHHGAHDAGHSGGDGGGSH